MQTATLNADAISFVCTLVRDRSAIELDSSKSYLIDARLAAVARQNGFGSASELVQGLRTTRRPDLERFLVEAMTTNETSFFRDIHPFEALRKQVLPQLRNLKDRERSLNIWSAACSTGQELYSIAILIREHFPDLAAWKMELLGTDLSDEALNRARAARFTQFDVNRGLPAPMLVKYFQQDKDYWQLRPPVKSMATFRKMNLIESWPTMPMMDVVFLRNVLIYFSPETKKSILRKVRQTMAPHAVLFLGAAETTMNLDPAFERVQIERSVFYQLK